MTTINLIYIIAMDEALCRTCGDCLPVCKYGGLINVPGEKIPMVDPWSCNGCGNCITVCPEGALRLIPRGAA
jgi:MinD superfamily P-loop ATPase